MVELSPMTEREGGGSDAVLSELLDILVLRKREMPSGSYSVKLFESGLALINAKISEEAAEVGTALATEDANRVNAEIADLIYHLSCGMVETGKGSWPDVFEELARRRKA